MSNEYEDLIEELYKNHYKEMISYAMSSLRRDIAEEVVQDAFRIACTKKEILKEKDNKAAWLMQTLKYTMKNAARSEKKYRNLITESMRLIEISREERNFTDEVDFDLTFPQWFDSAEDYDLFMKKIMEEKTYKEIAEEMGISVEACRKRFERILKKLGQKYLDIKTQEGKHTLR